MCVCVAAHIEQEKFKIHGMILFWYKFRLLLNF